MADKTGAAKSVSEAARQLAEETGNNPETIRKAIRREDSLGTLSPLAGTDKQVRPFASSEHLRVALGEKEILETAR